MYSTDTRTLRPGDTYVAIRGELHDGHRFIPAALEGGAAGVVADHAVEVPEGVELTVVEDTVRWVAETASARVQESRARVVAITGSVGKTSVRTATTAVLAEAFRVVGSEGNKNTPLGLGLMLLNADLAGEPVLVLEMGARLPGDIEDLTTLFPPAVSIVTNVKGVHLETLGSVEGVAHEKGALVRALGADGVACLNGDDPRTAAMAEAHAGRSVLFGHGAGCELRPEHVTAELPILGAHAVMTALAAFAAGRALGMDDATVNRGLTRIEPEKGRLRRLAGRDGSTLIDDTYNASPDATTAALDVLHGLDGARRVAFLGDMLELGSTEVEQHADVLRHALRTDGVALDRVVAVGPRYAAAAAALPDAGDRLVLAESSREVAAALPGELWRPAAGDVVLVKGSQGLRMERVSEALLSPDLDPADVLPRQTEAWKAIP